MSIKRTIITTLVALTLVAVVAPGVAQGVTIDELMAQIAQLQAQLVTLSGGTTTTTTGTGACAGVTFNRNLTTGATGSDVKCLQTILNANGYKVSVTGAGSPGNETAYFGPATLRAVKLWQAAVGFTPANQVGPMTRAKLNTMLGSSTTPTTPGTVVPTGAGLSVILASDNPAATTLVSGSTATDGQGSADLAHFTFVNGDNAAVNVTSFKLNRTGVSQDTLLNNVYLYQGASRLTDGATVSSGVITFNGSPLFTVPAGGSITIRVVSDIYYGMAGQTVGVNVSSSASVTTNASSVKGNFPVSGNVMTTAAATLATASFAAATSTTPYTAGTTATAVDPQSNYPVWSQTVTVGTRAVKMSRFALYQTGSAPSTAIQNYRLYVDGTQVGATVNQPDINGYITFDLSSAPLTLQTGGRVIKVLADIIAGSSLNFSYALRNSTDAAFVDTQLNVGVTPTVAGSAYTQLRSCNYNTSSYGCTINAGSATFSKATDSPAGNIVYSASNAVLARFTITASGEPVKISDLYAGVTDSTTAGVTALANGALYANGVQIGSTASLNELSYVGATSGTHFTLGSALIVNPGSPVTLEIRADIKEASGTVALGTADALQAWIAIGSSNATGQVSRNTITTPSAQVTGNSLTVSTGTLSMSKYGAYTGQTIVVPQSNYKLGHFTLTGSTTEATNLNTIYVDLSSNTTTITNLHVKYGANTTSAIATPTAATTPGSTIPNNAFSINYTLPAGQTVDLEVYGNVNALAAGTVISYVRVDGTTSSSTQSVKTNAATGGITGQTITFGGGSFVGTQDPATPVNQIVAGGQSVVSGIFKFTAQNDAYTINELKFSLGTATSAGSTTAQSAITSVALKDATGQAILVNGSPATAPVQYLTASTGQAQYVAYFTGLSIALPANTNKSIQVVPTLSAGLSSDTASTNVDVEPYLTYVKASNSSGTPSNSDTTSSLLSTRTVNKTYAYKAVPTITYAGANVEATNGSTVDLYKFTVGAVGGPVALKQFKFVTTMSDNNGVANFLNSFSFFEGTNNITSSVAILNGTSGADLKATNSIGAGTVVVVFTTERTISSSTTYTLKANVNQFTYTSTAGGDAVTAYMPYDTANARDAYAPAGVGGSYVNVSAVAGVYGFLGTQTGTGAAVGGANLIWSDSSASNPVIHSYTDQASSADWYNGYLVLTGNLNTTTISAK